MKKLQTVVLAMFALFAFSAALATVASAEITLLADWLFGAGETVTTNLAVETSGQLLLEDTKTLAGAAAVLCSGVLDGVVGNNGSGSVTEVLNLAKEKIEPSTNLTGLALSSAAGDCVEETLCKTPIEVRPVGLPWPTLLYLMEDQKILIEIRGAGYELLCTIGGLMVEDTCTAASSALEVLNDPLTGDAESPGGETATPLATCTMGGAGSGVNATDELSEIKLVSGELLAVSSIS